MQRHPDNADLRGALGFSLIFVAKYAPDGQAEALLREARQSIQRGAELSPNAPMIYLAKAMLVNGPLGLAEQETLTRTALRLNPNLNVADNGLGEEMISVGRTDEGVGLIVRSVQLDPMSEVVVANAVHDLVRAGRPDEASRVMEQQENLWPDDEATRGDKYGIASYFGTQQDVAALDKAYGKPMDIGIDPSRIAARWQALATHDPQVIRRLVSNCFKDYGKSYGQSGDEGCLNTMVRVGDLDDAFRFAAVAYPDHRDLYPPHGDGWILHPPLGIDTVWLFTPAMKPFRDDPRFWEVAVRTGLANYWQTTQQWPDFCREQMGRCKRLASATLAKSPARHSG